MFNHASAGAIEAAHHIADAFDENGKGLRRGNALGHLPLGGTFGGFPGSGHRCYFSVLFFARFFFAGGSVTTISADVASGKAR